MEARGGDAASDPTAAERRLVQNTSWDASTLATDSIHSQRDTTSGSVSLTEPSASLIPVISAAAANAVASASEELSRPLKKRRTALSPPPPLANGGPEDLSCSASAEGPQSDRVAGRVPHEQTEQSDEDSVEPRLSAMEVMHGQWMGANAQLPHSVLSKRPKSTSFPGHHSVSCMHPEGDLVRYRSCPTGPGPLSLSHEAKCSVKARPLASTWVVNAVQALSL